VHKLTFDTMLKILESAYKKMRKKGGRKRKLSVLDMLVIMLGYYHDYRTMANIAFDYGVHKQRICEAINWVEQTLIKDGTFSLPSKRELVKENSPPPTPPQRGEGSAQKRPKYKQKASYSGKKNDIL